MSIDSPSTLHPLSIVGFRWRKISCSVPPPPPPPPHHNPPKKTGPGGGGGGVGGGVWGGLGEEWMGTDS
jgi:hypothetical protein